ncbi:tetratricopeptide repeat protein [Streptomyces boncukensis]|uniref:Tetratricopeptide repeat protein n=1 Tax=Streptomyces boncukensis TaxID=2711219 RepID=A0A6G4WZR7_9ACTN|nr:tetratricopeptide repeat protein [Streptomyces boncukensis]NGO70789.1 tetratricopeptide repeat protein [Streptomyces boncukensis]
MTDETRNTVDGQVSAEVLAQVGHLHGNLNVHLPQQHDGTPEWTPSVRLPAEEAHYVDRDEELSRVRGALGATGRPTERPLVVAVSGVGGVGKSAFGVRLAYHLHGEYAEGALYLDLDDLRDDDGAFPRMDVLDILLDWTGVRPEWRGRTLAAREGQLVQRTSGRRLVLVLDNVRRADEVKGLLPPSRHSVAVVISRTRLTGLRGALELHLEAMAAEYGADLLRRIAEEDELALAPHDRDELARLCAGFPAALHAVGGALCRNPARGGDQLARELRAHLADRGDPLVDGPWDAAYRELGPDAARLYRLLPVHPGREFTARSCAALLGEPDEPTASDALGELLDARLVRRWTADRFRMHDLPRAHARRRARRDGTEEAAAAARRRVVRWYRRQAERADRAVSGDRLRLAEPLPELPYAPDVPLSGKGEAARWLERERTALYGCVRTAADEGTEEGDADTWALCEPLWTHFVDHRYYGEAGDAFRAGRDAAGRAGHPAALARLRCQLARVLWETGEWAAARQEVAAAVRAAAALAAGHSPCPDTCPEKCPVRVLEASTREFRGLLRSAEGDWAGAAEEFTASRHLHEGIPNPYGVLLQTYLLGRALTEQGRAREAVDELTRAHEEARAADRARMTGRTAHELARALRLSGARDAARVAELYARALASARERDADREEAQALTALAALAEEDGDSATAEAHRARVRDIERRAGGLTGEG